MKKRCGYTLAEVLTVLLIIGVIAAMTVPGLVNNSNDKANGTRVARAVELFQNGVVNIMTQAQEKSEDGNAFANISAIQIKDVFENAPDGLSKDDYIVSGNNLLEASQGYFGIENYDDYAIQNIKDYEGNDVNENFLTNTHAYKFSKAVPVVIFQDVGEISNPNDNDAVVTRVLIDANGNDRPNRLGRDVFLFGLSNSGTLIPAGTQAYNDFDDSVEIDDCKDEPNDGSACAARLMADGWQIKY